MLKRSWPDKLPLILYFRSMKKQSNSMYIQFAYFGVGVGEYIPLPKIRNFGSQSPLVIKAIREAQPHCSFILDTNGKCTSEEAIMFIDWTLYCSYDVEMDVSLVLFKQPVHKDNWRGLADLSALARGKYGIHAAANESWKTLSDVRKVVEENIVDVINIKLAKFGVLGALHVIDIAKKSGFNLVMDSLVETRLATRFAGHLVAGFGWFKYVNLDAPFLLSEDPIFGGYEGTGLNESKSPMLCMYPFFSIAYSFKFHPVYNFTNARGVNPKTFT
ncbi:hypothetical protein UlMin_033236 [Ulmus minor]